MSVRSFRDCDDVSFERRSNDAGDAAKAWLKEPDVIIEGPGITSGVIVGNESYFTITPTSESRYRFFSLFLMIKHCGKI